MTNKTPQQIVEQAIDDALNALAAKACHYGDCTRHDCVKVREAIASLVDAKHFVAKIKKEGA